MLIRTIQTDTLFSSVYDSRSSMGYAAAEAAASAIRAVLERKETANVIFAAAPSQNEMLESLLRQECMLDAKEGTRGSELSFS